MGNPLAKILENKTVRLLPLSDEHEDVFIKLANIREINQRVNKPFPYTEKHFSEHLANIAKATNHFVWMIEQDGMLMGVINSAAGRHPKLFQGGYWVHPDAWGQGCATTALLLVKDFLLNECGAERIQAVVEPHNTASIRVLEKCGYSREGLLKKFYPSISGALIDVFMYAVVKSAH
ncbi:MAG: GNAT family N-acetyltransferase [Rickettsiales bacterium]